MSDDDDDDLEDAPDLDEIVKKERTDRYASILAQAQEDISQIKITDRLWATEFERQSNFEGERYFLTAMKRRRETARAVMSAATMITRSPEEQGPTRTFLNFEALSTAIAKFYTQIKDHQTASDFLNRFVHWTTSPDFNMADLPPLSFWNVSVPRAFHAFSVEHHIKTSSELGDIEWKRNGVAKFAVEAIVALAHNRHSAKTVSLFETDRGIYAETSLPTCPLNSMVEDRHSVRLAKMIMNLYL